MYLSSELADGIFSVSQSVIQPSTLLSFEGLTLVNNLHYDVEDVGKQGVGAVRVVDDHGEVTQHGIA